ncbi:MAG: arginine--tRNA ligase, partial [Clostridia bacterium]|nr:arginine--tRNA ligase [Clostridia bacterium]
MINLVDEARRSAAELIEKAYLKAVANGALPQAEIKKPVIEEPKDIRNGDLACSFAMQNVKIIGRPPRVIADAVIANMEFEGTFFSSADAAGPGFINLHFSHSWFEKVVEAISSEGEGYGRTQAERKEKVMVEFVSANPTGPMHMGNARGGVLGDSLAEVLARAGNDVTREFLVNDAGNQIEKFALSLDVRFMQLVEGEDKHPLPEDCYQGIDIVELAQKYIEQHGTELAQRPQRERMDTLSAFGLEHNIPKMKSDLKRYGIEYDRWFFESELHQSGYVKETVDLLTAAGATYEQDGALWIRSTDFGCEKDDVLRRANGFYTYFAADIAYHRNKFAVRGFDRVINIWGADHHGHVARLKAAMQALGINPDRLEIILMQLVRLVRDGEAVRMSKRTGKAITLNDLIEETGVDAARFYFNLRQANSHFEFDLELAVRQSSENPVFYVQYAHARICGILSAMAEPGYGVKSFADINPALLSDAKEIVGMTLLAQFP